MSHPTPSPSPQGDGTGPDIWKATKHVLDSAVAKAYGGQRRLEWLEVLAGEKAFNATGQWLPAETLDTFKRHLARLLTGGVGGWWAVCQGCLWERTDSVRRTAHSAVAAPSPRTARRAASPSQSVLSPSVRLRPQVGIKGPLTTPVGGGIRSLNVALRQELDLCAPPPPAEGELAGRGTSEGCSRKGRGQREGLRAGQRE